MRTVIATLILGLGMIGVAQAKAEERIVPSAANPAIQQFNDPDLVLTPPGGVGRAPLVVYMPGTGGRSETAPRLLLHTIAAQGYPVIFLTYDDTPAVSEVCPTRPPACSGRFRESRVFGGDGPPVGTPQTESIVQRLSDLLAYLHRTQPGQGWESYVDANGRPVWPHIVLSGLSQGAGMAAFMAKRFPVDRVVLFSSPWDVTGFDQRPAPWLYGPSATPPWRWWAERHARENTTRLIANAYQALQIPADHILIFNEGLPNGRSPDNGNPYHGSTVYMPGYVDQWRVLFGAPSVRQSR